MAKLVFVLLLSLFFVQAISATRTTVTTVVVDDDESSNQAARDCRKEVQEMDFNHCEQFLQGSRSAALVNFLRQGGRGEEKPSTEQLKSCCDQLQKVDPQCQCDAFAHVITKHGGGGGGEGGMKIKEVEKAMLSECGLIRCEIPEQIRTNTWRF